MENIKQHDHRTTRRPDCVTEIRMGNTVLVVSGFFKKDTTSTAADNHNFFQWRSQRDPLKFINQLLSKSYKYSL